MPFIRHTDETKAKLREAWKRRRLTAVSAETRQKMSVSHKGRKFSDEHKEKLAIAHHGKNIWSKGRQHREESKMKMSVAKTGKPKAPRSTPVTDEEREHRRRMVVGENNPQWKGGITKDLHYMRAKKSFHTQKRRARLRAITPSLTWDEWELIKELHGHTCPSCGTKENLSIDHIIPISRGGAHSAENIQPLCRSCNNRKGTKTIRYQPLGMAMVG